MVCDGIVLVHEMYCLFLQHFLNFLPLPHGHDAFGETLDVENICENVITICLVE
jgi:hypothetical protein